ncbi:MULTISPECIES: lysylphosphatidylglycerol synthase transmembrane domain-containing protein [Pelosinus]|uniref:Phosphatidylglycerol lysyltransferase n=1 Tax=Pelosinus fermentans B4 TaxID=1149862 RepID=I8RIN1_9FIRM|nr:MULTISPECIES: lysylphosphatidylglycerol synthase transmembrane domain-containing protein [Pelosinus]EIW19768.1 Lysylphosphatidylglycerol synthetase/UPF0104 [Pelosinus fermentans B4]EIW21375.1 hypothetical protein FA11_1102 [Pelosinus fermentans A11]OAM94922.1 Lysylphosphatidylglycerol synthetase/glycosyltransferase AglD [Pelosinus fermentans DSM 17108]SDR20414.1 hypothetical protein SAMN04515679_3074 [Pelosinus fermentans]
MNYYKRLVLLVLFIIGVSGMVIYLTGDINMIVHLNAFRPWSIILAFLFLSFGMYFDSTRLVTLAKMAGKEISLFQSLQVILSNYFLAMLTPGATGGPVAQVLFLRKLGVPTGQATVLVFVRTILSILFLIICLPVVFYLDVILIPWLQPKFVSILVVALMGIMIGSAWGMRTKMMARTVLWIVKRTSNPLRRRIWRLYCDILDSLGLLLSSSRGMARVFIDTGLSLLSLYAIVPALFLGLGITVDWPIIMGRMIILNLLLYFAPTPGGTGIAEGGFVYLFGNFVPAGTVGLLAVVWRILAEYLPFAAGMYFTLKILKGKLLMAKRTIR